MADIQAEVDAKATAVRELKAAKASAEVIKAAVDSLLDAKARLKASTEVVAAADPAPAAEENKGGSSVTPWSVEGEIDYLKLVKEFGTELIEPELLARFERVTGHPLHPWLKRGIFFSHRKLDEVLAAKERGDPIFLYTGRGPSSGSMHLGHLIPFTFTKWLQDVLDCPLVIQMADDEKYYFKDLDFSQVHKLGMENAKDIAAFGFDPKKTFMFSNRDYRLDGGTGYEAFVSSLTKHVSLHMIKKTFGFTDDFNLGQMNWPVYQSAAAFSQAFPHIFGNRRAVCLVAYAIDQDPYFRLARVLADKLHLLKPCSVMSTFIPPLTGPQGKMSSSTGTESTLFLVDDAATLKRKVMKYAFSGGQDTAELHRKLGGDCSRDTAFQYLQYFEPDDARLEEIRVKFTSGEYLCGELKQFLVDRLVVIFEEHQRRRAAITDELMADFFRLNRGADAIALPVPKTREVEPDEEALYASLREHALPFATVYHDALSTDEERAGLQVRVSGLLSRTHLLRYKVAEGTYQYILHLGLLADPLGPAAVKVVCKAAGVSPKVTRLASLDQKQTALHIKAGFDSLFALLDDTERLITHVTFAQGLRAAEAPGVYSLARRIDASIALSFEHCLAFAEKICGRAVAIVDLSGTEAGDQ